MLTTLEDERHTDDTGDSRFNRGIVCGASAVLTFGTVPVTSVCLDIILLDDLHTFGDPALQRDVFVIDASGNALAMCTRIRAQQLLERDRASLVQIDPFTIRMERASSALPSAADHGNTAPTLQASKKRKKRQATIRRLLRRDGNTCFYCGLKMSEEEATIEHFVALASGGPDHPDNLALAHANCNLRAGSLSAVAKVRLRSRILRQFAENDSQFGER
ncbi:HNH endonuclease [Caballeronia sp. LZ032]|nr:HNH endonuclease [Caballeronia sp. LZ032]